MMRREPPGEVTREQIMASLERGQQRFKAIEDLLGKIHADLEPMKKDIAETRELVEAWDAVKLAGRFVKWIAGVVAAVVAIGAAIKVGVAHVIK